MSLAGSWRRQLTLRGINYILQTGLTFPGELSAIAILISYWDDNSKHAGAYITAFLIATMLMNVVGVK